MSFSSVVRTAAFVASLALPLMVASPAVAAGSNPCNPCAAKKANPCNPCGAGAMNPCGARSANPCNPCGGKAMNPCGGKAMNPCNPCGGKKANPCNPCGAQGMNPCDAQGMNPCGASGKVDPDDFVRPEGLRLEGGDEARLVRRGKELWNDTSLSTNGMACATCHAQNASFMPGFAEAYPHPVAMVKNMSGVEKVDAAEMVQFCMVQPMQAEPLPWRSTELAALAAYVEHVQDDFRPNPCAMRSGNPCNPCAARNPCAGRNPCGARNPCGR